MRLVYYFLIVNLLSSACSTKDVETEGDAGPDVEVTGEICEALSDPEACESAGCSFVLVNRGIFKDGVCRAYDTEVGVCLALGEPVGNMIVAWTRVVPTGREIIRWGYAYVTVDGWEPCEDPYGGVCDCGVKIRDCEAQTNQTDCENEFCFWAPEILVGIVDEEVCLGFEQTTIAKCLTPEDYLEFHNGEDTFHMNAELVTYHFQSNSGIHVYRFLANPAAARFRSGTDAAPIIWNQCNGLASDPPICDCPAQ